MKICKEETQCRICKGNLIIGLDFGEIYPSTFLSDDEKISEDQKQPLILAYCESCGLVQLKHTINLDNMYRQYWYSSSLNKSMVSSLDNIVRDIESRISLDDGDTVLDIGCNDGTMLQLYSQNVVKVGFDPALNLNKPDCIFINDYFSADKYFEVKIEPARIITAIAMLYDLPDPNKFIDDVSKVLSSDGLFVVQLTDLLSMIKVTAFDNICHEHLEYYTLDDLKKLFEAHGLDIIDVSYNNVNGGSVRVIASHTGRYPASKRVILSLVDEHNFLTTHTLGTFMEKITETIYKVHSFLEWSKSHDHVVYALGASTKGNTLLQLCKITDKDIPFIADVNKEKHGLRTVGSNIKIISEEDALIKHPKYFLVPIWHFKESLLNNPRIQDFMNSDGVLVFPLPEFKVVTKTGEWLL